MVCGLIAMGLVVGCFGFRAGWWFCLICFWFGLASVWCFELLWLSLIWWFEFVGLLLIVLF